MPGFRGHADESGGRPIPAEIARKLADPLTQSQLTAREIEVLTLVAKALRMHVANR
jgi:DNA-binding NarL/FixJ family response regulator